jgi:flagellar biosynthesis/type III secretory pathway protein FliH
MKRSSSRAPLRRLIMAAMFCGLVFGAGAPAVAHDGGGSNSGGYYRANEHRHDPSYRHGYRLGYEQGYDDGQQTCDSRARHRDNRNRHSQSQYDRGFAKGYDDGHRAACKDHGAHGRYDPSYRQGYRVGYREGFEDGQQTCGSRHRDNRKPSSQSRYDRGYADGYNAGHRAACE